MLLLFVVTTIGTRGFIAVAGFGVGNGFVTTPFPESTLSVFAADHPDARNAAINIMYHCAPTGRPIRRRAPGRTRH
jgi:hypothetical protein